MYIGVDLGTTNIKAALYSRDMALIDRQSLPVIYVQEHGFVEFDAAQYAEVVLDLLGRLLQQNNVREIRQIAFTGQAESLVVLGKDGRPLMNAISWMDERSTEECAELAERFPSEVCAAVTGQLAVLPTWPATKILWLRRHCPEIFRQAGTYMMLKDYIVFYLTGRRLADMSIATFSFYFDIYHKRYWKPMLDALGIAEAQLPALCEPCTVAGPLLTGIIQRLGLTGETAVNVGTLDHFAGMIGTGNIRPGMITLSTGTVMALATLCSPDIRHIGTVAMHYGYLPDSYVLLPVAESGGASLEWFRKTCMPGMDYDQLNQLLKTRHDTELLFLPYLVGTSAPEFDTDAVGVFWGLRQEHDACDMAKAVMEGVTFVLKKNCEAMAGMGMELTSIIATGGGSRSALWCQIQADVTGLQVRVPREKEAACLGAAMIAAVGDKRFLSYAEAVERCVSFASVFRPQNNLLLEKKYRRFLALYRAAKEIHNIR